jgi:hypothetical protein
VEVAVQRINIMWPIASLETDDRDTSRRDDDSLVDQVSGLLDGMDIS